MNNIEKLENEEILRKAVKQAKELGYNQKYFAIKMRMTYGSFCNYMAGAGTSKYNLRLLQRLLRECGVDVKLLDAEGDFIHD